MRLQTFRGRDLPRVFEVARQALGDDVMIVRTRTLPAGEVEVVAVDPVDLQRFRRRLEPRPLSSLARRAQPLTVALVGPTGAGKTTTLIKLAVHPQAFGGRRVGLITLDTYRVGAVEQLGTFAEIAGLPLEVVYSLDELPDARKRLASCDVLLLDTPGRSPREAPGESEWGSILQAADVDEVHLVLPATVRPDVAEAIRDAYDALGATHLLLSKLDEVPGERGLSDLAACVDLPARWVTDGQEVPTDLRPAVARILASLDAGPAGWAA